MFKRTVCVLVMLAAVLGGIMVTGCGDDIKTERRTEIQDMPVGQPRIEQINDAPQTEVVPVGEPIMVVD